MLRARVTGVEGRETKLESFEDVRERGSLGREYTVTYRDRLEPNETVVEGAFWNSPSADAEVSIEEGLRERFNMTSATRCASTSWAGSSARVSRASAKSSGAMPAAAGSCSCSGPASSTTRRR